MMLPGGGNSGGGGSSGGRPGTPGAGGGGTSGGRRTGPAGGGGSSGGRSGGNSYHLGHRPYWQLVVDGQTVWMNGIKPSEQPNGIWREYECAIDRLDVILGIDMVQTATFDIIGPDAAYAAQQLFPRRTEIEIFMGYD